MHTVKELEFRERTVWRLPFLLDPEPDEPGWKILESVFHADKQTALMKEKQWNQE